MKKTKVIIDRKKWYRGKGAMDSFLRLPTGKQCCLGFACRVLGAKVKYIVNCRLPCDVNAELPGLKGEEGNNTQFSQDAAVINDDICITDKERERKLKSLAKEAGFDFQFVG